MADICGIVLAAGAGTRAGGPKALLRAPSGEPWLALATTVLLEAGCRRVILVLGPLDHLARPLVPEDPRTTVAVATDWAEGLSASLDAGLAVATGDAALVSLVDLPDLPAAVARRVLASPSAAAAPAAAPGSAAHPGSPAAPTTLATALRQATFGGRPGHPVLIGRDHWAGVRAVLTGDSGARDYLRAHDCQPIECGDLWDGADRDHGYLEP